jgi:hypothetical protein
MRLPDVGGGRFGAPASTGGGAGRLPAVGGTLIVGGTSVDIVGVGVAPESVGAGRFPDVGGDGVHATAM